jgi:membrane-bound lytic murein transglycosylase D
LAVSDIDGPLVRNWERWYAERPDYVQRMTERAGRYLFHIVEEVDRRGLPMELALLPFIESAFNPRALSTARASGIWQFMPATGRDFDLTQNLFRDDRRDVQASTRAALDYLQALHGMFGDWHLALAAYNWGQGNVQRAIARQEKAGLPVSYDTLRMPEETRNYVPKLQAVENIVRDPSRFGLNLVPLENHPFFLSVPVERDIDVNLVARLAGLPLDEFHALNPQLNKPVVLAAGTPELLLPYDNAQRFLSARQSHRGPLASWTAWVAPRTLRAAEAARLVGMAEGELRQINRIPSGMRIRQGSTLMVARAPHVGADVPMKVADTATIQLAPEAPAMRKRYVKVGTQPQSLAAMARRHGVDRAQLARWNGLPSDAVLQPGQRLVVMVAASSGAKPQAKKNAAKAAARPRGAKAQPPKKPRPAASRAAPSRKSATTPSRSGTAKPAAAR